MQIFPVFSGPHPAHDPTIKSLLNTRNHARPLQGFKPNPATGNSNVAQNKLEFPLQIGMNGVHCLR